MALYTFNKPASYDQSEFIARHPEFTGLVTETDAEVVIDAEDVTLGPSDLVAPGVATDLERKVLLQAKALREIIDVLKVVVTHVWGALDKADKDAIKDARDDLAELKAIYDTHGW